jgi:hypothetical protein
MNDKGSVKESTTAVLSGNFIEKLKKRRRYHEKIYSIIDSNDFAAAIG